MPQFGRPSADTYNGDGWEEDDGTTVTIYDQINESVASDAEYIRTQLTPTNDVYVTKLTNLEDPVSSTGHIVRVRRAKSSAGGDQIDFLCELRQGYVSEASQGTLIATVANETNITETFTTVTYTLSAAEADAITDYTSLFLRMRGNKV